VQLTEHCQTPRRNARRKLDTTELKPGYEAVFTVTDYYDGPRQGIANYLGTPHFYECMFDAAKQNYSELFRLMPIDPEIFQMAMEDWAIWQRWESAFHVGTVGAETHPALPHETKRHVELKGILDKALIIDQTKAITLFGQFQVLGETNLPKGVMRPLQVKWTQQPRREE
jgi:hypothetical protein